MDWEIRVLANGTSSEVDGDPVPLQLDMRDGWWWVSARRRQSMDFPLSCSSWRDAG